MQTNVQTDKNTNKESNKRTIEDKKRGKNDIQIDR